MGRNGRVVCVWDFSLDKLTLWQEVIRLPVNVPLVVGRNGWMDGVCVRAHVCAGLK